MRTRTSRNPHKTDLKNMRNANDKDGNSDGNNHHPSLELARVARDRTLMIGEQSVATLETRVANPGALQHFQTALINLVSKANKLGLSLPIGLRISSPYDLTIGTP